MKALDLFCGMGGLSEGLELAGFEIQGAVDSSKFVVPNYKMNFPDAPVYQGDARHLLEDGWRDRDGSFPLRDIDLLAGGPPCQGVSQIGPRNPTDDRNLLFDVFMDVAKRIEPPVVLMENVPNFHKLDDGHFHERLIRGLGSRGYGDAVRVNLHSERYGVPQKRERAFYLATHDDFPLPVETRNLVGAVAKAMETPERVAVWDAIGDLPPSVVESGESLPYPESGSPSGFQKEMRLDAEGVIYDRKMKASRGIASRETKLYNHHTKDITEPRLDRIRHLEPGDNGDAIPNRLWDGRPWKFRRLPVKDPSHTLLAQMHRDLSEWVHPHQDRWITVREALRLQSFHDGFVLGVSERRQLQQVGNAVPPLLGRVAGECAAALVAAAHGKDPQSRLSDAVQATLPRHVS